jgi:hypothetical protein
LTPDAANAWLRSNDMAKLIARSAKEYSEEAAGGAKQDSLSSRSDTLSLLPTRNTTNLITSGGQASSAKAAGSSAQVYQANANSSTNECRAKTILSSRSDYISLPLTIKMAKVTDSAGRDSSANAAESAKEVYTANTISITDECRAKSILSSRSNSLSRCIKWIFL